MNEPQSEVPTHRPPEVVEAFTLAAITAMQELVRIEASPEELSAIAAVDMPNVVAATVRLTRPIPGHMTLVMSEETAKQIAARYLPQETLLNAEIVDDLLGEIANVIAGQAKTILKGTPYHFKLSIPFVARAANISQLPDVVRERLLASLSSEVGRLLLFVDLPPCAGA